MLRSAALLSIHSKQSAAPVIISPESAQPGANPARAPFVQAESDDPDRSEQADLRSDDLSLSGRDRLHKFRRNHRPIARARCRLRVKDFVTGPCLRYRLLPIRVSAGDLAIDRAG